MVSARVGAMISEPILTTQVAPSIATLVSFGRSSVMRTTDASCRRLTVAFLMLRLGSFAKSASLISASVSKTSQSTSARRNTAAGVGPANGNRSVRFSPCTFRRALIVEGGSSGAAATSGCGSGAGGAAIALGGGDTAASGAGAPAADMVAEGGTASAPEAGTAAGGGAASPAPAETAVADGTGLRNGVGAPADIDRSDDAAGDSFAGAGAGRAVSRRATGAGAGAGAGAGTRLGSAAPAAAFAGTVCGGSTSAGGAVLLTIKSAASAASLSAGFISSGLPSLISAEPTSTT